MKARIRYKDGTEVTIKVPDWWAMVIGEIPFDSPTKGPVVLRLVSQAADVPKYEEVGR